VKLPSRSGVGATSKPLSTLAAEKKAEAVKAARSLGDGVLPRTGQVQNVVLRLQKHGEFIVLFWSKDLINVRLEASDSLSRFPIWEVVDAKVEAMGGQMVVLIPMSSAMKFYRLHRP